MAGQPPDVGSTPDSLGEKANRVNSTPRWLNGALTGVVLTSAVVAALDRQGQGPNPVDDIAWILITLASTGLVRAYASFVAGHSRSELSWASTSPSSSAWESTAPARPATDHF